jgi:hypothetical protein
MLKHLKLLIFKFRHEKTSKDTETDSEKLKKSPNKTNLAKQSLNKQSPIMAANWVAVTSGAVVSDASDPVDVKYGVKGATIAPRAPGVSTGTVLISFPSGPDGSNNLKSLDIHSDTVEAQITKCTVYHGPNQVYSEANVDVEDLSINRTNPGNYGWTVSLDLLFSTTATTSVTIHSARLQF